MIKKQTLSQDIDLNVRSERNCRIQNLHISYPTAVTVFILGHCYLLTIWERDRSLKGLLCYVLEGHSGTQTFNVGV